MGEGGTVNIVRDMKLKVVVESFRDWGRDCWCDSGKDNTCGKRFNWTLGELPHGYDHKYIYSHVGYNLKPLDLQAAIGRQQLKKLPAFIAARKLNWDYLRTGLAELEEFFEFSLPTHASSWTPRGFVWDHHASRPVSDARDSTETLARHMAFSSPSWFGFMLRVRPTAPFARSKLAQRLDEKRIGNRMLFGGNLVRQPVFLQLKKDRPHAFRTVGDLSGADEIMTYALFLGTYPGLTRGMLDFEIQVIHDLVTSSARDD